MLSRLLLLSTAVSAIAWGDVATSRLTPETMRAFDQYVKKREGEINRRMEAGGSLWCLENSACRQTVRGNAAFVEGYAGRGLQDIRGGLVHDWMGATFIPGATLDQTLALLRNYNNHKNLFAPEVMDSRVIENKGDDYRVFLKLRKKKILTVILNTEYDVIYRKLDAKRAFSRSYSTKIAEVEDDGGELPAGNDHGFMWRLNAYWRFQERDGGVYVECETISLSRPVPMLLSALISPILKQLPRESLEKTLLATRGALVKR
jgi:hypothetical protein